MIAFSLDIDWAPEPLIEDALELFSLHEVPCTIFATHESKAVKSCNRKLFEIGIHPNFNPLLDGSSKDSMHTVLDKILNLFPEAKGVRSHSLTQSSRLLAEFTRRGLVYEANQLIPYSSIAPYRHWTGLIRVPFNWEDDVHFCYGKSYLEHDVDLTPSSFNVFNFHPIHTFLNTDTAARYEAAHPHNQDPIALQRYKNTETPGTRTLLINLLKECRSQGRQVATLLEVASRVGAPAPENTNAHR